VNLLFLRPCTNSNTTFIPFPTYLKTPVALHLTRIFVQYLLETLQRAILIQFQSQFLTTISTRPIKVWRERQTNKMQQSDVYYQLLSQHVSGIIMLIFRRTAYGVLLWFCWMWLVAVVRRCFVGCEHCSHPTTQSLHCSWCTRCGNKETGFML